MTNGDAFLTKPEKLYLWQNIKEITNINPKLSTTGGTSDADSLKKFLLVLNSVW